ncbi:MAG: hypothetical protein ACTHLD_09530 [Chitinophaga sp.]
MKQDFNLKKLERSFVNPSNNSTGPIIICKSSPAGNIIAVSLGTGLLFIARDIPDHSLARFWLTMISPAVSVFSTWIWRKLNWLYAMLQRRITQLRLKKKITSGMKATLTDPDIPDEEKEKLKRERAKLKVEATAMLIRKLKALQDEDE